MTGGRTLCVGRIRVLNDQHPFQLFLMKDGKREMMTNARWPNALWSMKNETRGYLLFCSYLDFGYYHLINGHEKSYYHDLTLSLFKFPAFLAPMKTNVYNSVYSVCSKSRVRVSGFHRKETLPDTMK